MTFKGQKNFCIAPFTQITLGPKGHYSPCPEIGGRPWNESTGSPIQMWDSQDFKKLRQNFANNEKSIVCNRCWEHENNQGQSLRRRLFADHPYQKHGLIDFINQKYETGPKQINLMVGNKCNLRCRICSAQNSVTYNKEGKVYESKFGIKNTRYTSVHGSKQIIEFSDKQIQELFQLSSNLERIEFYGGEPLLDLPTLDLLDKLIKTQQSQNITLFYNTNCTNLPTHRQIEIWKHFKKTEMNLSIDDVDQRFKYNRHPATWDQAMQTLDALRSINYPIDLRIICTVSILNIFYLPEILLRFNQFDLPIFLNIIHKPDYYNPRCLPAPIKKEVRNKLMNSKHHQLFLPIINSMEQTPNDTDYLDFQFWTRAKDQYRAESFQNIMPEFYDLIIKHDSNFCVS